MEGGILAHIYHIIIYRNNLIIFLNTPTYLLNCCSLFTISCQWPVSFVLKQAIPPSWINLIYSVYSVGRPVTKSCSNMTFCLKFEITYCKWFLQLTFALNYKKTATTITNKQTNKLETYKQTKKTKTKNSENEAIFLCIGCFSTFVRF